MTQRYGMDRQSSDGGDQPLFRVLSDEKRDRMHEASMEVLETIGLQVTRPDAAEMMGHGVDVMMRFYLKATTAGFNKAMAV